MLNDKFTQCWTRLFDLIPIKRCQATKAIDNVVYECYIHVMVEDSTLGEPKRRFLEAHCSSRRREFFKNFAKYLAPCDKVGYAKIHPNTIPGYNLQVSLCQLLKVSEDERAAWSEAVSWDSFRAF